MEGQQSYWNYNRLSASYEIRYYNHHKEVYRIRKVSYSKAADLLIGKLAFSSAQDHLRKKCETLRPEMALASPSD